VRRRTLGLIIFVVFAAGACADSGTTPSGGPTGPSSPTVTSVTISGILTITNIGQSSQLSAIAHSAKGTTQDVTAQATWASVDSAIATVSSTGLVTSKGVGTATITATYQNVSGSTRVTVTRPPSYVLSGLVTESVPTTSTILSGARIEFVDGVNQGKSATTDSTGHYEITQVSEGTFSVRATLSGYADTPKQVTINANSTLDFALVPTLKPISESFSGSFTQSDPASCDVGSIKYPCRVLDLSVHNPGPLSAVLTWLPSDAYLLLQLYSVDARTVLRESAVAGATTQSIGVDISTPGRYQLRVVARTISATTMFTLAASHMN